MHLQCIAAAACARSRLWPAGAPSRRDCVGVDVIVGGTTEDEAGHRASAGKSSLWPEFGSEEGFFFDVLVST